MPGFKLTIGTTELENDQAVSIKNIRPENDISTLEFVINNYQGKNYADLVNKFDQVQLDLKCKNHSYTTTFIGEVVALQPSMSPEVLTVYCEGFERALKVTHSGTSWGLESLNPTINTPRAIIQDLVDNYVEKTFTGNATNWTINSGNTYVDNIHSALTLTNLTSKYLSNFMVLNRLCDIVNAYAQTLDTPDTGIHWFAEPSTTDPKLYIKEIADDHSDGNWNHYYGGTQSLATVTQGVDLIGYNFHQEGKNFANNVVLSCAFRKPAYDYWTEDSTYGGQKMWAYYAMDSVTDNNAAGQFVVGTHSLKFDPDDGGAFGKAFFPATFLSVDAAAAQKNVTVSNANFFKVGDRVTLYDTTISEEAATVASIAGSVLTMVDNLGADYAVADGAFCLKHLNWDLTKVGSMDTPPTLNLYGWKHNLTVASTLFMFGTWVDTLQAANLDRFSSDIFDFGFGGGPEPDDKFIHKSIPIGPYWNTSSTIASNEWVLSNDASWANIDFICVSMGNEGAGDYLLLDDLHLAGHIIREARDAGAIDVSGDKERQAFLRLDTAIDDSLETTFNDGTAARLAASELFKRNQFKTTASNIGLTGTIGMPMKEDLLPGQVLYVNAGKRIGGTYRHQLDMRVSKVTHLVSAQGYITMCDLTSDLWNSNTFDTPSAWGIVQQSAGALGHAEARDLKASGVDINIPRFTWDPTA